MTVSSTTSPASKPDALQSASSSAQYPARLTEVGIQHMAVYIPRMAVAQDDLERHDRVPSGKYTIGLGQLYMSFVSDREDVISLALTAVSQLVRDAGISYSDIGRLEVGTETVLDKSKSIKTSLMRLFADCGNSEVEGLDNTNACYGGTAALFNTVAWCESSAWDGRYAVVVAADISVYEPGPARPTGGAGAVAMLVTRGDSVPIRFEIGLRATCMGDTYDFFKPRVAIEYPTVRGQQTIDTFVNAMDQCYQRYARRAKSPERPRFNIRSDVDYCVFHAPFNKMVHKSFARLIYNDFLNSTEGEDSFYQPVEQYRNLPRELSHRNREAQRAFVKLAKENYEEKCAPAAWLAKRIGNCYTASLYSSLAALIFEKGNDLIGKRILLYSFGSGFASSMFSLRVIAPVDKVFLGRDLRDRLDNRIIAGAEEYIRTLSEREQNYGRFGYAPRASLDDLLPGTWYLREVLGEGERSYDQVPFRKCQNKRLEHTKTVSS
ncbi:unnamed protein product [Agarophyton chilense]